MNLFWLKYVSYAFLAGAAFFYFAMRLNKLGLSLTRKAALYVICIVAACLAWHVQESNAALHSPRLLIIGKVLSVNVHHGKRSIDDDVQLQMEDGSRSPIFSTDYVADGDATQPIHVGDVLGVLYRTWDNVPVTIDELQGQQRGWHYRHRDNGSTYIFGVALVGFVSLLAALITGRKTRAMAAPAQTR